MKKILFIIFLIIVAQNIIASSPRWDEEENKKYWTKLMIATYNNDKAEIECLLKNGAEIEEELKGTYEIKTAVYISILANSEIAFETLIANGANLNHRLIGGNTYLFEAVLNNKLYFVKRLIEKVGMVNEKTIGGRTPLMAAASNKVDFEIFQILLNAGAEVNAIDISGFTALQTAIYYGNYKKVELLIENGANKNIRDKYKKLPIDNNIIHENDSELIKENRKKIAELLK